MLKDILTRETWIKGYHAVDKDGNECSPLSKEAVKFDLFGALVYLYPDPEERLPYLKKLQSAIRVVFKFRGRIHEWNDSASFSDLERLFVWLGY